jgi:hypothetical protein
MGDANQPLSVRIEADWAGGPFWVRRPGDSFHESYDAEEIIEILTLSADLVAAFAAWADRYQAILNQDYPPDSAFASSADEVQFVSDGSALARRLKLELPAGTRVTYVPRRGKEMAVGEE